MTGGLVAVHAHPDDESLATGALLATWAAAGLPTTVVTCTRGERGEVIGSALAHLEGDGPALARHRTGELAAALAALGVTDHVFLDEGGSARFEDSGMAWLGTSRAGSLAQVPAGAFVTVPLDDAVTLLARVLRERRPEVVVTYEPAGGYGHPDHVRAHQITMRAVEAVGGSPVVLWAAHGRSGLRAAYRALRNHPRSEGLSLPDPDGDLPSVAVPEGDLTVEVDVRPVRDRVLAALRAHATQVQAVRALDDDVLVGCYALSNDVLAPLLRVESYRTAPASPAPTGRYWPTGVRPVA